MATWSALERQSFIFEFVILGLCMVLEFLADEKTLPRLIAQLMLIGAIGYKHYLMYDLDTKTEASYKRLCDKYRTVCDKQEKVIEELVETAKEYKDMIVRIEKDVEDLLATCQK